MNAEKDSKKSSDQEKIEQLKEKIKTLENKVSQHQAFINSFLDELPFLICAVSSDGEPLIWNLEAEQITGYSRKVVLGNQEFWKKLYPDYEYRQTIFQKGEALKWLFKNWSLRVTTSKGEERVIAWTSLKPNSITMRRVRAIGIGIDITYLTRLQESLKETEELYRKLFDQAGVALMLFDTELNIIDSNKKAGEVFGYSPNEFLKLSFPALLDSKNREEVSKILKELSPEGLLKITEKNLYKHDGTSFWADLIVSRILVKSRTISLCNIRDISERKKLQANLEIQKAITQTLAKDTIVWDRSGNILHYGSELEKMLGWTARGAHKSHINQIIKVKEDSVPNLPAVLPFYENEESFLKSLNNAKVLSSRSLTILSKSGDPLKVRISPQAIFNDKKSLVAILASLKILKK